ncbi:hypothetical protein K488DRAFT_84416 [Vararia minispora EC-137]|uniref:Uncharacterized protein n=1 Tax=Vararia minispora EC-137 TaxID=1314806 RepID=A0ACB8QQB2_9AGAM|nr:hypothetical protein K488DRAFT_84416 [Vararia minispora EC-137]
MQVIAKVDLRTNRPTTRPVSPYKQQSQNGPSTSPDLLKPREKVSSSANVGAKRRISGSVSVVTGPSSATTTRPPSAIPRPASPTKASPAIISRAHSVQSSSSHSASDASVPPRTKAALTQHVLSRQRSLTSTSLLPTVSDSSYVRERRGSGTFSSLSPAAATARSHLSPESATNGIRVKSKVSSLAKAAAVNIPASAPASPLVPSRSQGPFTHSGSDFVSPPYATTRPVRTRVRSPPVLDFASQTSSSLPSSPVLTPSVPYPLSNGNNIHGGHARYQSFSGDPALAKVDVAALPPLPQSPPTSTVSFSSHSSRSSLSHVAYSSSATESSGAAPTVYSHHTSGPSKDHATDERPPVQRATFDAIVDLFDPTSSSRRTSAATAGGEPPSPGLDLPKSEGSQIRAAAKSNRKIEDLEITNRSLLAINATLEAAKHKQAKEIRELRRKLRESRLILPPRAYRAVKSSDPTADDEADDEDEDDEDEEDVAASARDETYVRVRNLLDGLLDAGRRALASTPEDHAGAKVLSAEEVRSWRGGEHERLFTETEAGDVSTELEAGEPTSEDEVEAALGEQLPSITIGLSP